MAAPLGDVADVQLGKMLDKKRTAGTSLPYLRNANVRWGHIDVSDLLEMPFKNSELERYAVRSGDVMICEGGEPGRAAVWTGGHQDLLNGARILDVRGNKYRVVARPVFKTQALIIMAVMNHDEYEAGRWKKGL